MNTSGGLLSLPQLLLDAFMYISLNESASTLTLRPVRNTRTLQPPPSTVKSPRAFVTATRLSLGALFPTGSRLFTHPQNTIKPCRPFLVNGSIGVSTTTRSSTTSPASTSTTAGTIDCSGVNYCSGRGLCIGKGRKSCFHKCPHSFPGANLCSCNAGWTSRDCSSPVCNVDCGLHGFCAAVDRCQCDAGWTGDERAWNASLLEFSVQVKGVRVKSVRRVRRWTSVRDVDSAWTLMNAVATKVGQVRT